MKRHFKKPPGAQNSLSPFDEKKKEPFFPQNQSEGSKPAEDSVQPLPKDTQQEMGAALGADFSKVKVHTGKHSGHMNESMNSQAFTYGQDIYFNRNGFNDKSERGKALLAHELVHTLQQTGRDDGNWSQDAAAEGNANELVQQAGSVMKGEKAGSTKGEGKKGVQKTGLKVQRCGQPLPPAMVWVVTVPKTEPGPGGWKMTSTTVTFMTPFGGRTIQCPLTIEVPIENFLGPVSDGFASEVAIASMEKVGREMQAELNVMDAAGLIISEVLCAEYRARVMVDMQTSIPGTRVRR